MRDLIAKAGVLVEALPYIRAFSGKTVVIKYGGHAMTDDGLKQSLITDLVLLKYVGIHPVLVHGGGPEITALMKAVGKEPAFVDGLRVTDHETARLAEMVLVGRITQELVALINAAGGRAAGVSGKDGALFRASRRHHYRVAGGEPVDLGFVGDVAETNPALVVDLVAGGYIPVVAPTGWGEDGETYNINADSAAGALAAALGADKLVILTDVEGIKARRGDSGSGDGSGDGSLLSVVDARRIGEMIAAGELDGGMIPKVEACLAALAGGVRRAHIVDGRLPHALLLEVFTDRGVGTMVVREPAAGEARETWTS